MSSNIEDLQANRVRYYGMQRGVVTRIDDPEGLHRVKATIQGVVEPETDWLFPITFGGGSPQRGGHVVPAIGSDLAVWFHNGDPNGNGGYAAFNWGVPKATGTEAPGDVKDAVGQNPELVQSFELGGRLPNIPPGQPAPPSSGSLRMTVDERPGHRSLQVLDVDENGVVQCAFAIDREQRAITLQAVSQIRIKCMGAVVIEALEVNINGRRVAPGPAQI